MTNLTLDAVTKRFAEGDDEIIAVDNVSMEIDDGEFLVIVGPSGCGKTTTLRMIAGLESISDGKIRLGDRVINDQPPQRRDIAMVFQSYALYPHMTVSGNMRFGLEESTNLSNAEISDRVEETAEMLGIEPLLERKPSELSGGQQQRVALGRAIVRDPETFLLDEPLANLDAKLRAQMRIELQRLQEELATTTIYVTHDQTEAMTMGDRIAILNEGKLQQVGTPTECYHEPANVFVAGFIGEPSMNTLLAGVAGDALETDLFTYRVSADLEARLNGRSEVVLGVRPSDIDLVEGEHQANDFECLVDVVEPVGRESFIYLKPDPEADQSIVAIVPGTYQVEEGETVTARIPEHVLHIFDAESGDAIRNRLFPEGEREPTQQLS